MEVALDVARLPAAPASVGAIGRVGGVPHGTDEAFKTVLANLLSLYREIFAQTVLGTAGRLARCRDPTA